MSQDHHEGAPIARDEDRFRYLSNEPPAILPEGFRAPLSNKTTRELIAEREDWLRKSEPCKCCGGNGRTLLFIATTCATQSEGKS